MEKQSIIERVEKLVSITTTKEGIKRLP